eukprot:622574-Rhodomonas_salina.2
MGSLSGGCHFRLYNTQHPSPEHPHSLRTHETWQLASVLGCTRRPRARHGHEDPTMMEPMVGWEGASSAHQSRVPKSSGTSRRFGDA